MVCLRRQVIAHGPLFLSWSSRCCIEVDRRENGRANKKIIWKTTYPPPADGPCVLFLCKFKSSASDPAAQAGRGASQAIAHFTVCKFWKRSAARLHSGALYSLGREIAADPGSAGRKTGKRRFERVFHFAIGLFRQVLRCVSEPQQSSCNARQLRAAARFWVSQGFHKTALVFYLVSEPDPFSENGADESAAMFFSGCQMAISS